MLDHDHDHDSATLLRQRSLRRTGNIQHSPVAVAHVASRPNSPPTTPPHPRPKLTGKKTTFGVTITTVSDALRRIQPFRHVRSSSSPTSTSTSSKTNAYHKRKPPHARSHSISTGAETQSQTQTSAHMHPSASAPAQLTRAAGTASTAITRADVPVPPLLREGTQMTKVTSKKRKKVIVRLDPDIGQIIWEVMQPAGRQRLSASFSPPLRVLPHSKSMLTTTTTTTTTQSQSKTSKKCVQPPTPDTTENNSSFHRCTKTAG
jgi:hypothetical protein